MSLTGADPMLKGAVMILKTADQHDLWKLRVADACWAATGKDVFSVDDDDCDTAILCLESPDAEERKLYEWLNKCWLIVRNSLHDDLYRRVSHVKRGMLESLFTEIGHATPSVLSAQNWVIEDVCRFKQRLLGQLQPQPAAQAHLSSAPSTPALTPVSGSELFSSLTLPNVVDEKQYHFVLSMLAVTEHRWVLDSGATSCATNDEADCTEVRPCSIEVTAAGTSFRVLKMGTALIQTQDEQGKPFQLRMANTLISPQFTYKLLALQPFTAKGLKVIMEKDAMRIRRHSAALGASRQAIESVLSP